MDKKAIQARRKALVEAYTKSRFEGDNTPEETISILEGVIGHCEAILAIAELVNTVGVCLMLMRLFLWREKMNHRAYNFFEELYDRI